MKKAQLRSGATTLASRSLSSFSFFRWAEHQALTAAIDGRRTQDES
jgi:hypothetical protein